MSYDNPDYYKGKYGLEAIEVIKNFFEDNAFLATVFPYLARLGKKDSVIQDLDKSIWWLTTYRKHLVDTGAYDPKAGEPPFPEIVQNGDGTYSAEIHTTSRPWFGKEELEDLLTDYLGRHIVKDQGMESEIAGQILGKINPEMNREYVGVEFSREDGIKPLKEDSEEELGYTSLSGLFGFIPVGATKKARQHEKTPDEIVADLAGGKEFPKLFIGLLPQTLISGTFNRLGMASGTLVNQNGAFGIDGKGKYFGGKVGVSTGGSNNLRDQVLASDMIVAVIDEDNTILYDAIVNLPNGASITFGGKQYEKIDGFFTYHHHHPEGDEKIPPNEMLTEIVKSGTNASVDYGSMVDYFALSGIDQLDEKDRIKMLEALPNSTRLYCDGWCGEYNYVKFGAGWLPADSVTCVTSEDIAISADSLTKLNAPLAIFAAINALPEGVRVKRSDNSKDYIEVHKYEGKTVLKKCANDMFISLDEMLRDLLMLNHEYRIFRNLTDS